MEWGLNEHPNGAKIAAEKSRNIRQEVTQLLLLKLLHFGPEIQAVELAISQKEKEKNQSPTISVKTGLNLRRQWSLMSKWSG